MWKRISWLLDQIGRAQLLVQILVALATGTVTTATINAITNLESWWLVTVLLASTSVGFAIPVLAKERGWVHSIQQPLNPAKTSPPNVGCRRVFGSVDVIGNTGYRAVVAEIANEISDRQSVGEAKYIRAYLVYRTEAKNELQTVCPGRWPRLHGSDSVSLSVGESENLLLAIESKPRKWFTSYWNGVSLAECRSIELRLLDVDGRTLAKFDFSCSIDDYGTPLIET